MSATVVPMLRIIVGDDERDASIQLECFLMFGEHFVCAACLSAAGGSVWSVTVDRKAVAYALCASCSAIMARASDEKDWRAVESRIDANIAKVLPHTRRTSSASW